MLVITMASIRGVSTVHAQGLTGQISGVVTDSGGGVMPGAIVTLTNVGTNLVRETVTVRTVRSSSRTSCAARSI